LNAGVGYIPEDRAVDGLVREFSVSENLVLDTYNQPPYGSKIALNPTKIEAGATEKIDRFDIRTRSTDYAVGTLSGGNQQKVIVAREMSRSLKLLVAAQPTRGVDVGSIEFIHSQIIAERDRGTAVLLVSSELDEVLSVADRVAVMYRGRVLAVVPPDTPREEIGLLMAGITGGEAPQSAFAASMEEAAAGPAGVALAPEALPHATLPPADDAADRAAESAAGGAADDGDPDDGDPEGPEGKAA
jgi:simple sugar transport system ATP-binding protein